MSFVNSTTPAGAIAALRVSVRLTGRALSEASLTDATSRPHSLAQLADYLQLDPASIADLDAEGVKALVEHDGRPADGLLTAAEQLEQIAAAQADRHGDREQQLRREAIEARLGEIPADPNDVEAGTPPTIAAIAFAAASTRPSDIRRAMATALLWRKSNPEALVTVNLPAGDIPAGVTIRGDAYGPTEIVERTADDVAGHDA